MKRPTMLAACGAAALVLIAIWFFLKPPLAWGVSGEITVLRILRHASKWQVLLAAFVALVAATLAYRGAMAKVNFDREARDYDMTAKTLALLLKLHMATMTLRAEFMRRRRWFIPKVDEEDPTRVVSKTHLKVFKTPPEFDEAWNNLDQLSEAAILDLTNLRNQLRSATIGVKSLDEDVTWSYGLEGEVPAEIIFVVRKLEEIEKLAESLETNLKAQLEPLVLKNKSTSQVPQHAD